MFRWEQVQRNLIRQRKKVEVDLGKAQSSEEKMQSLNQNYHQMKNRKTMRMKKSLVKRRYQKKLIHQMKNRRKKNRKCELEWDMMFIN